LDFRWRTNSAQRWSRYDRHSVRAAANETEVRGKVGPLSSQLND
jgi:hypothetical protein